MKVRGRRSNLGSMVVSSPAHGNSTFFLILTLPPSPLLLLSYTSLCQNVWSVDAVGCSGTRYICTVSTQQEVSKSLQMLEIFGLTPPPSNSTLPSYSLFLVTFSSFLVAFLHFASEVFLYRTADQTAGSILPLIVSGQ